MTDSFITTDTSLLPYLGSENTGFRLQVNISADEHSESIFDWQPAAGPFSRMLPAALMSGQKEIASLLIMVQPDEYPSSENALNPITNADIDQLWHRTLQYHQQLGSRSGLFPIGDTAGSAPDAGARSYQALFYCQQSRQFFHPACPRCGQALSLCRDEALLKASGLSSYANSLDRYMVCAHCVRNDEPPAFYCRKTPMTPVAYVSDRATLIAQWQDLLSRPDLGSALPCHLCRHADACANDKKALRHHIVTFSFYPFYLLAFRGADINLVDFLPLLAGADQPPEPPAQGARIRFQTIAASTGDKTPAADRRFFFNHQPRWFAEILYLKLNLLRELAEAAVTAERHFPSGLCAWSLESFWVQLGSPLRRLPHFWQFGLQLNDMVGKPTRHGLEVPLARAHMRQFLGSTWFYVLLVNGHQTIRQVLSAVETVLTDSRDADADTASDQFQIGPDHPVFAPDQVFWQSSAQSVDATWHPFWQDALRLGVQLLASGVRPETNSTDPHWQDQWQRQLEELIDRLHIALFDRQSVVQPADPIDTRDNDRSAIVDILDRISQRWAIEVPAASDPAPKPNEDGDYEETVILASEQESASTSTTTPVQEEPATVVMRPPAPAPAPESPPSQDFMEKTVVMAPPSIGHRQADDMDKTVVLSPGGGIPEDTDAHLPDADPDKMAQTIVQTPLKTAPGTGAPGSGERAAADGDSSGSPESEEQEDLEKTVVIQPGPKKDG